MIGSFLGISMYFNSQERNGMYFSYISVYFLGIPMLLKLGISIVREQWQLQLQESSADEGAATGCHRG